MNNTNYKRKSREVSEFTKKRISQKLRGRVLPDSTKSKISQSLKNYWSQIPAHPQPDNADQHITMDDHLIGANQNKPNKQ